MSETPTPIEKPVRITVGNLKGGVGRSTTSMFLALALARRTGQRVLVVDADGVNGTSFEWSEMAGEIWPSQINIAYWPSLTLAKRVKESGHEGHVIIDTGPNDAAVLRQALMVSDYLVMPIAASPSEVARIQPTLAAASEVGINREIALSILFTRTKPNTISLREAREALRELDMPVLENHVPFKIMYSQAYGTVPEDLGVYPAVLDEILAGGESA
jgi:chromosome partitioning protein